MQIKPYYSEILTGHNVHPRHRHILPDASYVLQGVNPGCGDNITLQLSIGEDGIIRDGAYTGDGCAVSQASTDMMLDLVIGRTKEEALRLTESFMRMIHGEVSEDEINQLGEAAVLREIGRMPSRVKCAVLGWRTMEKIIRTQALSGG